MKKDTEKSNAPALAVDVGSAKARETILALANYNSWRRGDEALEMPDPAEIGASIDDAVNLLRRYDEVERENARLRESLQSLAYLSRDRTQTRITLRDRIADILSPNNPVSESAKPTSL